MIYKLTSILLLTVAFFSCNNEDVDSCTDNCIYYSFNESEKQILNADDAIYGSIGSTFTLYLNSINDPRFYFNSMTDSYPVNVTDNKNGEYTINFTEASRFIVIIEYYLEKNSLENKLFRFYINLQTDSTYQILNNTCVIDVENDSLKNIISTEVRNIYMPLELCSYKLSYEYYDTNTETASGNLIYSSIGVENEHYEGSFTKKKDSINVQYNNLNLDFTRIKRNSTYYLKQDLTGIFKTKYSLDTINEISITSEVLIK
ncbi:hypothetical protein H8788_17405 [Parabacteroides faecis]|mgnify:FL=1|uniref:hypothetical protein n=1 Tax=Parabacteroides TaxID=375288 RepID=UPI000F004D1A|nr:MULTISPECIES: hypothetical protein [Parabacteroides]MBC8619518.1 hypothetical protein [Parabacteroides faecis]RHR97633.1 hypothetical protein DWW23_14050 [Parabacteroides sp. AF14-59]